MFHRMTPVKFKIDKGNRGRRTETTEVEKLIMWASDNSGLDKDGLGKSSEKCLGFLSLTTECQGLLMD